VTRAIAVSSFSLYRRHVLEQRVDVNVRWRVEVVSPERFDGIDARLEPG
jgi:hypothetical protein